MNFLRSLWQIFSSLCTKIPDDVLLLLSRLAMASVFWRSAQTKISGWNFLDQSWEFFNVSGSAFLLFQYDYDLPLLPPKVAAYAGTAAEFFFSLMLALGLFTRFSTAGLLTVTCVIQFLVYPDAWPTHILWFALLLYLLKQGGGRISLDYGLFRPKTGPGGRG